MSKRERAVLLEAYNRALTAYSAAVRVKAEDRNLRSGPV